VKLLMLKPQLIIITGRPGSGKTTFAKNISDEFYMPLISRDKIKEGFVHTCGIKHTDLPQETNKIVTNIFFDTLKLLINNNVSMIAEAAFQHGVWASNLEQFKDNARIHIIICKVNNNIAYDRFIQRKMDDTHRDYFHGDDSVEIFKNGSFEANIYDVPHLNVPTYHVDTLNEYKQSIQELRKTILNF